MSLTKVSGDVIQGTINLGIVTATRIDGNVNGDVNSTGVSTFTKDVLINGLTVGSGAVTGGPPGRIENTAFGYGVLGFNQLGELNVGVGYLAMRSNEDGNGNIAIGANSLLNNVNGDNNTSIGYFALRNDIEIYESVAVGAYALYNSTYSTWDTAVGTRSLYNQINSGYENTSFGSHSGFNIKTGRYNLHLGSFTGLSTTASRRIIIGTGEGDQNYFDAPDTKKDTQFAIGVRIDSNPSKYWLVGDENFNIGIGTTNPGAKLQVSGGQILLDNNTNSSGNSYIGFGTNNITRIVGRDGNTSPAFLTFNIGTIGESARFDSVGNLGIGTTNPQTKLQVGAATSQSVFITSTGNVGLASTNPRVSLDASQETDAIALPQGTTAQRPSGNAPYIRYNTTNSALEFYNGTDWVEIISDYFPTGSVILG